MVLLESSIVIHANIDTVWHYIKDVKSWATWNHLTELTLDQLVTGAKGTARVCYNKSNTHTEYPIEVFSFNESKHEFVWGGSAGSMFFVRHWFKLTALDEHTTQLVQNEEFSGTMAESDKIADTFDYAIIKAGYPMVNEALKKYIEQCS